MDHNYLRKIAAYHALRLGLSRQDVEDCAGTFVMRFLTKQADHNTDGACALALPHHPEAWWHLCAKNHALNYRRGLIRYNRNLDPYNDAMEASGDEGGADEVWNAPLATCLRREAYAELNAVLNLFPERTRRLFVAHHLNGMSLDCLAQEHGMQRNTVSQTLFQARARLRLHLERRGWTQSEFITALRGDRSVA